jgi:prepilin-type N-terminal cleavage/methylation domain-containing protein
MYTIIMKNRGFTLVEMIVSLAIFAVVAVIAIGALLKVIDANKKAQSITSSVTNLNFALESMSREFRTGKYFTCGNADNPTGVNSSLSSINCSGLNNTLIAFNSPNLITTGANSPCNAIYMYRFSTDVKSAIHLQKAQQTTCGASISGDDFTDLISPTDVTITPDYKLGVLYVPILNTIHYPLVFIRLAGYAGTREQDKTYVDVETAVSARTKQ